MKRPNDQELSCAGFSVWPSRTQAVADQSYLNTRRAVEPALNAVKERRPWPVGQPALGSPACPG